MIETGLFFLAKLAEWGLRIYGWMIIIAILMTWVNPDPRNPVVRFLHGLTYPLWTYLAKRLPPALRLFSAYASLLLVWFLEVFVPGVLVTLAVFAGGKIAVGALAPRFLGYFLLGAGSVIQSFVFFLIVLLLIWFFLALINPSVNSMIVRTLFVLVDPFITPIQRALPRSRMDFSPLIAAGIFFLFNFFLISKVISFSAVLTRATSLGAFF